MDASLTPTRPSYTRLCISLEQAARWAGVDVHQLDDTAFNAYAAHRKWSDRTRVTMRRVGRIHGLNLSPTPCYPPRSRPESLSKLTVIAATDNAEFVRDAFWARASWIYPASIHRWTQLTFADVTDTNGMLTLAGRTIPDCHELHQHWTRIIRHLHGRCTPDTPLLCRIDIHRPITPNGATKSWRRWATLNNTDCSYDQWRRHAITSGARPVDRYNTRTLETTTA